MLFFFFYYYFTFCFEDADTLTTYHTPLTHLVDNALGIISDPCCMKPPTGNQRLFPRVYWFSNMSLFSRRHG